MPSRARTEARENVTWGTARPVLVCMLCGRQVGELVGRQVVHHAGCSGKLTLVGRTIRCCACRGSVTIEEV